MKPILLVKTGTTIPPLLPSRGDFERWFEQGLKQACEVWHAPSARTLPNTNDYAAVVITGSSEMVSHKADWSERTAHWLASLPLDLPVLGICYGHQLLAHALGGLVGPNPRGRQIGTVELNLREHQGDTFLAELPTPMAVQVSHSEAVLKPPEGAIVLGATALDPNHVIHYRGLHWGLQCHPEFDVEIVRAYLDYRRVAIAEEGLDVAALLQNAVDTPWGDVLLARFARLATRNLPA